MTWSFGVFFDLRLNKRSNKQSWGSWFETPSCSLWRHCNDPACIWSTWGPSITILVYTYAYVSASIRGHLMDSYRPWLCFNIKTISPGIEIPTIKIRRSQNRVVTPSIWEWAFFSLYDLVVFHVYYSNYLKHVNELSCLWWLPFIIYYSKYHDKPLLPLLKKGQRGYSNGFIPISRWC